MIKLRDIFTAGDTLAAGLWPDAQIYHGPVPVDADRDAVLVEVTDPETACESRYLAIRRCKLRLTRFPAVSDYRLSAPEDLLEDLDKLLEAGRTVRLSTPSGGVRVDRVQGAYGPDYAQGIYSLSWEELDEGAGPGEEYELMEHFAFDSE